MRAKVCANIGLVGCELESWLGRGDIITRFIVSVADRKRIASMVVA